MLDCLRVNPPLSTARPSASTYPYRTPMSSLFDSVELAPRDPILGLNEQYNADTRPGKVNLGVGVYYDDDGRIPLLTAVRKAEIARIEAAAARRSEEHTSELQSLMRISYAVFCLKKKTQQHNKRNM